MSKMNEPRSDSTDELAIRTFGEKMTALTSEPLNGRLEPTGERIQAFEGHIGARLPDDYRVFVNAYGGVGVSALCPIKEPCPCGQHAAVEKFYGFMDDDHGYNSLSENSDDAQGAPAVIPIGEGAFGSQIYLFVSGGRTGEIYFYDHDQRSFWPDSEFRSRFPSLSPEIETYLELRRKRRLPSKDRGFENFYLVASSFSEFLSLCTYWDMFGKGH